jgi:uncharacterized damage-inducible protein DinB
MKHTPGQADFARRKLLEDIEAETQTLINVVKAIPDAKLGWKPAKEKCRAAGELAAHAASSGPFFCSVIEGGEPKDAVISTKSKKTIVAGVKKVHGVFKKKLSGYSAKQLAKEYDFFGQKVPGIELMTWHHLHLVHHRAQVATYLRVMGAKVPSIYGPSGDEGMPAC